MNKEIDDLTFSELCTRIKQDYVDKLPDSAYDSPECLIITMKALQKKKPDFQYATGYNFYGNVLKSLVIEAAINYSSDRFTLRQLCEFRNLPLFKVQVMVSKWNHRGYPYFTKLKKRTSNHENIYKLRKYAVTSYIAYKRRLSCNFDLNLHRAVPKKLALYVNINRYGKEMGLQMSDLPDVKKGLGIE